MLFVVNVHNPASVSTALHLGQCRCILHRWERPHSDPCFWIEVAKYTNITADFYADTSGYVLQA